MLRNRFIQYLVEPVLVANPYLFEILISVPTSLTMRYDGRSTERLLYTTARLPHVLILFR